MTKKIAIAQDIQDYNILQNNGRIAHQVVDHVHFHLIPKPNETEGLGVGWPTRQADKGELQKLLEEMGRVSLPAAEAVLLSRLVELRTSGEAFAKRFDSGESGVLTSAEFRAWTERLVTLLTAMNPADPVTLPERPEFWV